MLFMFALFNMSELYKSQDRIEFSIANRIDVADRKFDEGWSYTEVMLKNAMDAHAKT